MAKKAWTFGCLALVVLAVIVVVVAGADIYNRLNTLDQQVRAQWAQVENVYQRRADLIPNLVETVKGAAQFEKDTFTAVTEARSRVGQVTSEGLENIVNNPEACLLYTSTLPTN